MGTSASRPNIRPGKPLVPPWADQDPPPPGANPPPPPPPSQPTFEAGHTTGFRRAMGDFYRTGDSGDARTALGRYARGSSLGGGGGAAGLRVARAARTGGAAFGALSSAIADQAPPAGSLDLRTLAGRPVNEAIDAIVDAFCPPGILDEDAIRLAMNEALAEALDGLDKFDPTALDDFASLVAIRCFVAELVFSEVMAAQGASGTDVSPEQAVARENDIRTVVRDTTDLQATPILQSAQGPLSPVQIEGLVKAVVAAVGREIASW